MNQEVTVRRLSVLVPAYNEQATIYSLLSRLAEVRLLNGIEMEVVVINDCSRDGTSEEIRRFQADRPTVNLRYIEHERNLGKGGALHTGIREATGDYIVIQDADLEYDPFEFNDLLKPILMGFADVVYGSRFMGGRAHRILFFWHSIGNKFLTFLSNALNDLNLTDMETCYKMVRADILKSLDLKERRFGFEPEVTAKLARVPGIRIYEVGISYYGRTYAEGKKIGWRDGVWAIYCIARYGLFR